jgi:hypothetical protein
MHKRSDINTKQLCTICLSNGSRNRINIINIIILRWGWDVAHRVKNRTASWVSWGNLEETHHLEENGIQGIILRWCFKK